MAGKTAEGHGSRPAREDRLKAALKANMARRKAQARARAAADPDDPGPDHQAGQQTPDGSE